MKEFSSKHSIFGPAYDGNLEAFPEALDGGEICSDRRIVDVVRMGERVRPRGQYLHLSFTAVANEFGQDFVNVFCYHGFG